MEERPCHLEVLEYCDLGNLSTALKYAVFQVREWRRGCAGQAWARA